MISHAYITEINVFDWKKRFGFTFEEEDRKNNFIKFNRSFPNKFWRGKFVKGYADFQGIEPSVTFLEYINKNFDKEKGAN